MVPAFLHIGLRLYLQPQIISSLLLEKVLIQSIDASNKDSFLNLGVRGHSSTMEKSREGQCCIEISKILEEIMNRKFL